MAILSVFRWLFHLLIRLPVLAGAYVIVPLAVKKSWRDKHGAMRLPAWACWYDDPSFYGNEGEPFFRARYEEHEHFEQMWDWLLRNKAYRFREDYIDPELVDPVYRVWGDQYIDKSTGRTGWLFATAVCDGRLYWNFAAVFRIYKNFGWQPYFGWGFKRALPVADWDSRVLADHSAALIRFTTQLREFK